MRSIDEVGQEDGGAVAGQKLRTEKNEPEGRKWHIGHIPRK